MNHGENGQISQSFKSRLLKLLKIKLPKNSFGAIKMKVKTFSMLSQGSFSIPKLNKCKTLDPRKSKSQVANHARSSRINLVPFATTLLEGIVNIE